MGDKSAIEWTDATWNPVVGCTRVSAGCDHCYAFQLHDQRHVAWKRGRWPEAPAQYHQPFSRVQLLPARLDQPLRWARPRRIFVNSLSDLFHPDVPNEYIARVFAVMAASARHTYQILTKRPDRMRRLLQGDDGVDFFGMMLDEASELGDEWYDGDRRGLVESIKAVHGLLRRHPDWPLRNVWLGTSTEDQRAADERVPALLDTPAAVRFLSMEPLLGAVELRMGWLYTGFPDHIDRQGRGVGGERGLHWIIVGGESGPHARPMHPEWVRSLRDQCWQADVPLFFKQWGEYRPVDEDAQVHDGWLDRRGVLHGTDDLPRSLELPTGWVEVSRLGKHRAGRELDGRTWDEYPTGGAALPA